MSVGIIRKIDKVGRITIPQEYRKFYHLDIGEEICIIDTPQGVMLTNPKYKVIEISNQKSDLTASLKDWQ